MVLKPVPEHKTTSFFAHSVEGRPEADWQPLDEHLNAVGNLAAKAARHFNDEVLALTAGLLHDLGKYTFEFQQRLSGSPRRVDHATWGARLACQRFGPSGHLISYAIAGHHAGLANGLSGEKRTALIERLEAILPQLRESWRDEIELPEQLALPKNFRCHPGHEMFQLAFLQRMVFSCLVDADFIDTDNFYRCAEGRPVRNPADQIAGLAKLRRRFDKKLNDFNTKGDVNALRTRILEHVRSQHTLEPGLFSLTVPTGGGKTLTSLAFALDHAIRHGLRRVIYVIPYTSIVEQTAAVFREVFEDLGDEVVLEHHSAYVESPSTHGDARDKLREAMENWDRPIVVTTAVQFFESLFADRPSRCRKLHNVAGSVVILDEAQTLPYPLLRPCIATMDELARNYRTSLVLCTATQPALKAETGFIGGLDNVRELAPEPRILYEKLRRVTVRHAGALDDDALVKELLQHGQVLCIVNNRRHARVLFESIAGSEGARHLTTLMCAQHRRQVLDDIRQCLQHGEPCRVVATSLIEAGVDVDFPRVLRAEAGLDSIAQAAGRCNREGHRSREDSEVLVFSTANLDWAPPPELKQFAQSFKTVARHHVDDLLGLDAVHAYFQDVYWRKGDELDAHALLKLFRGSRPENMPFETVAARFRMIESNMQAVLIPYDRHARDLLRALAHAEQVGGLARRLQPYTVQVPQRAFDALRGAGAIQPLNPDIFGEQFMQLVAEDLYGRETGLRWDNPAFRAAESNVI